MTLAVEKMRERIEKLMRQAIEKRLSAGAKELFEEWIANQNNTEKL